MGHGRALINVNSNKDQLNIYKKIISKNLSVRNTELLVRDLKGKTSKVTSKIKEKFKSSLLQTEVFINKGKNGKGNFVVNFDNEIEFERINKLLNDKQ
jgi:ParB family chromosome partitioning protein